jgi:hypothetical protein
LDRDDPLSLNRLADAKPDLWSARDERIIHKPLVTGSLQNDERAGHSWVTKRKPHGPKPEACQAHNLKVTGLNPVKILEWPQNQE